jgi:hypothetical protein
VETVGPKPKFRPVTEIEIPFERAELMPLRAETTGASKVSCGVEVPTRLEIVSEICPAAPNKYGR